MLDVLFWISVFSGGIMVLLLSLSLLGGLDLDFDLDADADLDTDGGGGLGFVKGGLTFLATSSWVFRMLLISDYSTPAALSIGILVGIVIVYLLSKLLSFLLKQTEDNTYFAKDAVHKRGKVYLRIPTHGQGIVKVELHETIREFKAKTYDTQDIPTGAQVDIIDNEEEILIVTLIK